MNGYELVSELIKVSQKAANLARAVRSEETLFSLLVEEKTGVTKNKRFFEDFKTLADVLVQEVVKHDLGRKFPGLVPNIRGEESNTFTNKLGESITVEVLACREETTSLLARVLDGNMDAAQLLGDLVHSEVTHEVPEAAADLSDVTLKQEGLGIWIDPIDSTAQYIHGYSSERHGCGVYKQGLQCVVVLIGVFDAERGSPVAGVINQPFSHNDSATNKWLGRYSVGFHYGSKNFRHSTSESQEIHDTCLDNSVVLSSAEAQEVQKCLGSEFKLVYAAGAGYKILCIIDGLVGSYVLSKASTFKWDSCSPHAVLMSLGGGILDLRKALKCVKSFGTMDENKWLELLDDCQICYDVPDAEDLPQGETWSNAGGVLAYRCPSTAKKIVSLLAEKL